MESRNVLIEVDGKVIGTAHVDTQTFRAWLNRENAAWAVLDKEDLKRLGIHRNGRVTIREDEET